MAAAGADLERSLSDSADEAQPLRAAPPRAPRGRTARAAALGAAAAAAFVVALAARRSDSGAARAAWGAAVGLSPAGQQSAEAALQAAADVEQHGLGGKLAPQEHLHDQNPCADDEEVFEGVCYEKCALLTGGTHVHRQSPWTCCNQATCDLAKAFSCCRHHIGLCSGFDIAGMAEGDKICPHNPGACLADEELFLDICYMKCSLLTNGQYPYRTSALSCCKSHGLSCWAEDGVADGFDGQAITDAKLAVGGGCGDASNSTSCSPHPPQQQLTEA